MLFYVKDDMLDNELFVEDMRDDHLNRKRPLHYIHFNYKQIKYLQEKYKISIKTCYIAYSQDSKINEIVEKYGICISSQKKQNTVIWKDIRDNIFNYATKFFTEGTGEDYNFYRKILNYILKKIDNHNFKILDENNHSLSDKKQFNQIIKKELKISVGIIDSDYTYEHSKDNSLNIQPHEETVIAVGFTTPTKIIKNTIPRNLEGHISISTIQKYFIKDIKEFQISIDNRYFQNNDVYKYIDLKPLVNMDKKTRKKALIDKVSNKFCLIKAGKYKIESQNINLKPSHFIGIKKDILKEMLNNDDFFDRNLEEHNLSFEIKDQYASIMWGLATINDERIDKISGI